MNENFMGMDPELAKVAMNKIQNQEMLLQHFVIKLILLLLVVKLLVCKDSLIE